MKGARTDLESRADLVEWNLIQSSWGKGWWRLWNKQVNQKSNEDRKQHPESALRVESIHFRNEPVQCMVYTGGLLDLHCIMYSCISVGMMAGWRYQATLSSPSNAIRRKEHSHRTLAAESSLPPHTHTQTHMLAVRGKGSPMWTRPQQTHGNLRNYTGRRRHFTACLQPNPSYTLVAHWDPE